MSPYEKRICLPTQLGIILCCQTRFFFSARVLYFIELSDDTDCHKKKKKNTADISFAKHNCCPSRTYELRYSCYKTKPICRKIKINYQSDKFSLFFWVYIHQFLLLIYCSNWDTWAFFKTILRMFFQKCGNFTVLFQTCIE